MKVLLISPIAGFDFPGGDLTYTTTLLTHPPVGVTYEHYSDAMRRGAVIDRACRSNFKNEPGLTIFNKLINLVKDTHIPYWEPFRFFKVKPGEYDVIHVHSFHAGFSELDCPFIITDGAPKFEMYRDRRGYSPSRIKFSEAFDLYLERLLNVNCATHGAADAAKVLVYSEHFRNYLLETGVCAPDKVGIVPLFLKVAPVELARRHPRRVGFVAIDFAIKGGHTLLRAFEIVRGKIPDAELCIVGDRLPMSESESQKRGINWLGSVLREELLQTVMPSFDVLAMPTPHDCFSFALIEGLALGLPIAASDTASLPEALDYGAAGLISPVGDAEALADNIIRLMDPMTNYHYRQAARNRFDSYFSWEVVTPRLYSAYKESIEKWLPKTSAGIAVRPQ